MSNVEFEDSAPIQYTSRTIIGARVKPTMIDVVKKIHLAKTDAQAYYMLLIISVVCFALAVFIFIKFVFPPSSSKSGKYSISPEVMTKLPPELQESIKRAQNKNK